MSVQEEVARINKQAWQYAEQVVSGEIPACRYVTQQCQNALDRMAEARAGACKYTYDPAKAAKPALFAKAACRHLKGPLAGKPIDLEPWQLFLIAQRSGWYRDDGHGVARALEFEVPRNNGTTTI